MQQCPPQHQPTQWRVTTSSPWDLLSTDPLDELFEDSADYPLFPTFAADHDNHESPDSSSNSQAAGSNMDYQTSMHNTAGGLSESAGLHDVYPSAFDSELDPNVSWLALENCQLLPFTESPPSLTAPSTSSDDQTPPHMQWTFVPSGPLLQQQDKSVLNAHQPLNVTSDQIVSSTSIPPVEPPPVGRRQRNTEAARRYRQRKVDRVNELEEALSTVFKERDELKLKLARAEAEAELLRKLVAGKS